MRDKSLFRLDLHALKCLCVLVGESHVSRAADRLGISQPAMSSALAQLREVFQDPLLVRTAKGMTPTPNALHIAESARAALDLIEGSFAVTRAFDPVVAQTIFRLSATESVGFMLVPRLTHKLEQVAPGVRLHISAAQPSRTREQLEEGEADLVVAYHPHAASALHTSSLYQQELRVVAASSHPGIQGSLSAEQYFDARHVHYKPTHGDSTIERQVDEAFASRGRTRRIGVSVPSALASAPIVAASKHIATLTRAVAEHAARTNDLQVLPLPFDLGAVSVSMFWHERTHAMSAHVWLRQLIRGLFQDL